MKKTIILSLAIIVVSGYIAYASMSAPVSYKASEHATSTPQTRTQKAEELINHLTEERKQDKSFIEETNRMLKELHASRERQARLDALMIVQLKIEEEAHALYPNEK